MRKSGPEKFTEPCCLPLLELGFVFFIKGKELEYLQKEVGEDIPGRFLLTGQAHLICLGFFVKELMMCRSKK